MSNQRFEKQRQFLQNRLSPEGYAGLHLTIGVLVVLLASWGFAVIAENLSPDNPLVRIAQRVAAWFVILLIGLTRVYLGAHFLSDVLGAFAASVVWLTFCWTAFETLRRRQKHRSE